MRALPYIVVLIALLGLPSPAEASCIDIESMTKWSRVDSHTIIVYRGSTAKAVLKLPYCFINTSSDIKFIQDYICNGDKIIVDGEVCDVTKIEKL